MTTARDRRAQEAVDHGRVRRAEERAIAADRQRAEDRVNTRQEEEEEDEPCGAKCFIRRIRESRMPAGFKLTSETPKYDGLQEPKTWIEDYLTAVQCQGGTRNTAMQYL